MESQPPLEMAEARFFDELGLPEWQRRALCDPRLPAHTFATLILANNVALLTEAVSHLAAVVMVSGEEEE